MNSIAIKILIALLFFAHPAWAGTWTTAKTGTDEASCVTTPPTTDCLTIQYVLDNVDLEPDDIVDIRAGTYTEDVTIGSGDSGSGLGQVTLQGHTGETVIIQKLTTDGADYFDITNVVVDGWSSVAGNVVVGYNCRSGNYNNFYGNTIYVDLNNSINTQLAASISDCDNMMFYNNILQSEASSWDSQVDLLRLGCVDTGDGICDTTEATNTIDIYGNTFNHYWYFSSDQSSDNIQTVCAANITVRDNYFNQPVQAAANARAQGIFMKINFETICTGGIDWGYKRVYNNLMVGEFNFAAMGISVDEPASQTVDYEIYNNTLIQLRLGTPTFWYRDSNITSGTQTLDLKNNILVNEDYRTAQISEHIDTISVDDNLHYVEAGGFIGYYESSISSLAAWNALAIVGDDLQADPSFDANYKPDSDSDPIVDTGTSLAGKFTTDKDGITRPQGSAWDIGAYEYSVGTNNAKSSTIFNVNGSNGIYNPSGMAWQ